MKIRVDLKANSSMTSTAFVSTLYDIEEKKSFEFSMIPLQLS